MREITVANIAEACPLFGGNLLSRFQARQGSINLRFQDSSDRQGDVEKVRDAIWTPVECVSPQLPKVTLAEAQGKIVKAEGEIEIPLPKTAHPFPSTT